MQNATVGTGVYQQVSPEKEELLPENIDLRSCDDLGVAIQSLIQQLRNSPPRKNG